MKAVILSGTPGTALFPLANCCPKLILPLANEPLLHYHSQSLRKIGISECAILSSPNQVFNASFMDRFNGRHQRPRIVHFKDGASRGTAGSLKEIEKFTGTSDFLVISSNVFMNHLNITDIVNFHCAHGAGVTMVVEQLNGKQEELENIEVSQHGVVNRIHVIHHSRNNRQHFKPSGIYVFNPSVYGHICKEGYMDIKEQLIPLLQSNGITVHAYRLDRPVRKIDRLSDYVQLNKEILLDGMSSDNGAFSPGTEITKDVWIGENVNISPRAYLLGPVVIGDDCVVEDNAHIVGPTSIGSGVHIEKDVLVRESIIWEKTHLRKGACVEYSLIGDSNTVSAAEPVRNAIVLNEKKYTECLNIMSLTQVNGDNVTYEDTNGPHRALFNSFRYRIFFTVKRGLDILFASIGLIFFLPLCILITVAIKIDSPGPVLYRQRRCGMEGKEFWMLKFRTMVKDAEKYHKHLIDRNDIDGPMFKMVNDPRITKVGKVLRRTSLDELPQFLNVLKGDMSMVGPRPLIMEEMRFSPAWRDIRLKVKPGLTGLWQISGRSDVAFHSWVEYDIAYVKKQSVWLDIMVLIKTVYHVLRGIGAK